MKQEIHNREIVRKLQNAHSDHIESVYRRLLDLQGNPNGVEILNVGDTRVFLSNENRLENRAIFTGNETLEELREATSLFEKKGVDGYFELNPANFYRTDPFSWKSEMLPALLELGYRPEGFRCVWYLDHLGEQIMTQRQSGRIKQYSHDEADEFIQEKLEVEPVKDEDLEREKKAVKHGFTKNWMNYIGFEDRNPVSISKLFIKNNIGFLAWGYTLAEHRRKGHHGLHVCTRTRDAIELGCQTVFSVTDFNIPSSLSLQKFGFRLAYNYILLERSPTSCC
ncbi:MAG: hypothetical protein JKY51_00930 [Opitutaceae bacterium]|nr:hypothetical protein [Opitutaceae bacterium]